MENEPSYCCTRIPRKLVGWLGIAFSFGLVAFFGCVFGILEVRLIFAVLIFFSNLVASFFWFNGVVMNRTEFMMASLVAWGIELNLWFTYLFWIVLKNAFENQYPGLIDLRDTNDMIIFALTVFFFVAYLLVVLSYVSIKAQLKRKNPQPNLGWKIAGVTAVWLLTSFAIAMSILLGSSPLFQHYDIWIKRLISVVHCAAAITWACGMIKNKSEYLLASLICYLIPLVAFLGTLSRELHDEIGKFDKMLWKRHISVFEVTALYMMLLCIAILSYFSMKKDFQKQRSNGFYTVAPTENKELDVYV